MCQIRQYFLILQRVYALQTWRSSSAVTVVGGAVKMARVRTLQQVGIEAKLGRFGGIFVIGFHRFSMVIKGFIGFDPPVGFFGTS